MAMTRYAGRLVAPTRVNRMRTAKWWIPLCGLVTGSMQRYGSSTVSTAWNSIRSVREGAVNPKLPIWARISRASSGSVEARSEQLDDGADVDERLGTGALPRDLQRLHVSVVDRERLAIRVRLKRRR